VTDSPTPSLTEFLATCDAAFAFLISDYGFERLPEPREYNQYSVCFRKGDLQVEVYGENWGQNASCDLLRGKDNLYLSLIIPTAERKPWPRGQLNQIRALAERLKLHASDFLRGDLQRFEAALAEWKRVTAPRPISEAQLHDRAVATAVTLAGHASKQGNYAEVVKLLEPHEKELSLHQKRMLDEARQKLKSP
jgi:hypothetical protein